VIAGDDLYGGTYRIFERVFRQMGLDFTYVDPVQGPAAFAAAARKETRLLWIETPTNPMLKLCDIAGTAAAVKQAAPGALVVGLSRSQPIASPIAASITPPSASTRRGPSVSARLPPGSAMAAKQ